MVIALGDARNWRGLGAVAAQFSHNKLSRAAVLNAYTAALLSAVLLKTETARWVDQRGRNRRTGAGPPRRCTSA
jgi:hypothetical protein